MGTSWATLALLVFAAAYGLVIAEEFTQLRKSKPMVFAAGILWVLVAIAWRSQGRGGVAEALGHVLLEYGGLLLFLLAAMTYVNTLEERRVFAVLRDRMLARGLTLRAIYWVTGLLAFLISPFLDNLTTALVMGTVALTVGRGSQRFIVPACVNIVVGANAGGAFTPFGDITTLMVWQRGLLEFAEFLRLFVPALVNWLVPALIMSFAVPRTRPAAGAEALQLKPGAWAVIGLFAATVVSTVLLYQVLDLPPFLGMMMGLGALQLLGHFIRRAELRNVPQPVAPPAGFKSAQRPFDIFISVKRVEWDTLLFFYGVVLCVGALGALGFLAAASQASYATFGPTWANIFVGIASAVVDNIPIMYAVLTMHPDMSDGQWLLVTLTAGVGGSLLSVGSAAGVALMGQARGTYTFFAHLRWSWAVALGYAASIWTHFLVNEATFVR